MGDGPLTAAACSGVALLHNLVSHLEEVEGGTDTARY